MPDYYEDYLNSLKAGQIRTHKEALQYFSVRYSSFIQDYPKDSALPACTLAQNGFYYDNTKRSIRCFECDFLFSDLQCELLSEILNKHVHFGATCQQAINSLNDLLSNDLDEAKVLINSNEQIKPLCHLVPNTSNLYHNEENRLKSFETSKLILNIKTLVKNGFYLVPKDPLKTSIKQNEDDMSIIENVSRTIPALYHVKCAFCPYECLLFRNSLLNTLYKSPFEEHKEKYFLSCPIFYDTNKMDCTPSLGTTKSHNEFVKSDLFINQIQWLCTLYEFDDDVENFQNLHTDLSYLINTGDDYTLRKIPKILEHLLNLKLNRNLPQLKHSCDSVLYIPEANSNKQDTKITSDFNKLQDALSKSSNVLTFEKAFHPAYSQYENRLETFRDWPATLSQQPSDLARAGFYYFGIKDMVKCFFCNGGLKNWDSNDDPFQDHVRWFPKCQFIRQLMGPEYVEQIREKFKHTDSGFTDINNQKSVQLGTNSLISGLPQSSTLVQKYYSESKRSVSPRTLNSRLDTNIIKKIADNCSISKDSLKKAIEIKLSVQDSNNNNLDVGNLNYGDDFKTPIDMAMFSYEIEQVKQKKEFIFGEISDFMLCNLNERLKAFNVRDLFRIKYGITPLHVRTIRESVSDEKKSNVYCLISLKQEDKPGIDRIIEDIQKNLSKKFTDLSEVVVIKTNWLEIEEKIKPMIVKQIDASTSIEQLKIQEQEFNSMTDLENVTESDKSTNIEIKKGGKELDEESMQLLEENERLKNERLCVVCLVKEKNVLFLPCAHLTTCLDCSYPLQTCPMCRSKIQATVRTFT